jgi:hypothetical protein
MIALLCSKIFPGQPYNPDRFRQAVIFGDSLSGIEKTESIKSFDPSFTDLNNDSGNRNKKRRILKVLSSIGS